MLAAGTPEDREWGTQLQVLENGDLLVAGNFQGRMVMKGRDLNKGNKEQSLPRLLGSSGQGALDSTTDDYEGFVARLNPNGSLLWAQTSGYFGNAFTKLLTVQTDMDGNESAYLIGESKQAIGMNPHLIKLAYRCQYSLSPSRVRNPGVSGNRPKACVCGTDDRGFFTASASSASGKLRLSVGRRGRAFDGKMPS